MLSGCGGSNSRTSGTGTQAAQKLVIISPHPDSVKNEFERAFKKQHPNVTFQWLNPGGSSDLLRFVIDQYKNKPNKDDGIGADVFFGGGLETFIELEEKELLQKLEGKFEVLSQLNGVPLRGGDDVWIAAALSGFGILYNRQIAARDKLPVPATWGDLGKKQLQGRIELADPRKSGSAHVAYEIILQSMGWDEGWKTLAAMAGNSRAFIESSSQLVNDVSSGEAVFVPAIDFYARAKINAAGKDKMGYIIPKEQSVVTPDPIGILRGARNKTDAEKFVNFVLSPEGQKLWILPKGAPEGPQSETLFRMPVLRRTYRNIPKESLIEGDPFLLKNTRGYNYKIAARRRQTLDDMIGAILIDNHDALKARQKKSGDVQKLQLVPEEGVVMAASDAWGDAAFAQQKLGEWREAARTRLQWY